MSAMGILWAATSATVGARESSAQRAPASADDGSFASRLDQASRDELSREQEHSPREGVAHGREKAELDERVADPHARPAQPNGPMGAGVPSARVEEAGSASPSVNGLHHGSDPHHHEAQVGLAELRPQLPEARPLGAERVGMPSASRPSGPAPGSLIELQTWGLGADQAVRRPAMSSVGDDRILSAPPASEPSAQSPTRPGASVLAELLPSVSLAVALGVPTSARSASAPVPAMEG